MWGGWGSTSNICGKISATYELADAYKTFGFSITREKAGKSSYLTIGTRAGLKITSLGDKIDSIGVYFLDENKHEYSRLQIGSKFIITKLDTVNKIISGEFEFILNEDTGSGKQIVLKNGRFDFKMDVCLCDSK